MSAHFHDSISASVSESLDAQASMTERKGPAYARRWPVKIALFWHTVPVMWRIVTNRWCVFKDAPDWVIHCWATAARRGGPSGLSDDGLHLLAEARDEWQLRKRKRQQNRRKSHVRLSD